MIFLNKRVMGRVQGSKARRKKEYVVANWDDIQFTYKEAREKYNISPACFRNAIDELIRVGLLDIASTGNGLHKYITRYALSDRWQKWGLPDFVQVHRPKRATGACNFPKKNRFGAGTKKKSTVTHSRI
jgi:hypothetical protein